MGRGRDGTGERGDNRWDETEQEMGQGRNEDRLGVVGCGRTEVEEEGEGKEGRD